VVTAPALAVKAPVVDPADTITVCGTETLVELLERLTVRSEVGDALTVTVQETLPGADRDEGVQERADTTGAGAADNVTDAVC
jgi:hypothetical protein